MSRLRSRTPGGFTLIELMVTMAIFAIMAIIAVPKMYDAMLSARIARLPNRLAQDVAWARAQAATTGEALQMTLGPGCTWSTQVGSLDSSNNFVAASDTNSASQDLAHSLTTAQVNDEYQGATCAINGSATTSLALSFDSRGFISTSADVTVSTTAGQSWAMQILASGAVVMNANTAS